MREKLFIILGCLGLKDNNIVMCKSVENCIWQMNSFKHYDQMVDFFDKYGLFDSPLFDYNAIRSLIFKFHRQFSDIASPIWTDNEFNTLEKFVAKHKDCRLYLRLSLSNKIDNKIVDREFYIRKRNEKQITV